MTHQTGFAGHRLRGDGSEQHRGRVVRAAKVLAAATATASVAALLAAAPTWAAPEPSSACVTDVSAGPWRTPLNGSYAITSSFGMRQHPVRGVQRMHSGVDLASGGDPVLAAADGAVVRSGAYGGLGRSIEIKHEGGVSTVYGHLAAIAADIAPGSRVRAGQRLGTEGTTGESTGVHLHFEVHVGNRPVDPISFMKRQGASLDGRPHAAGRTRDRASGNRVPLAVPEATTRKASLKNQAAPIPRDIQRLYVRAAERNHLPWQLLAGIGMAETAHGRNRATSSAGARGLMQFMPATWKSMGVDGDGDGRADITNDADSVASAARYLRVHGANEGPAGLRRALLAYNRADWYVGDVLHYAQAYGASGLPDVASCEPEQTAGGAVEWARGQLGDRHVMGAAGPTAWDGSSFVREAYVQVGARMPRTAEQQRVWLANGNGTRVQPGEEAPGDLIYYDSYRGPKVAGAVSMVTDPQQRRAISATNPARGVAYVSYQGAARKHHLFEIWRPAVRTPATSSSTTGPATSWAAS